MIRRMTFVCSVAMAAAVVIGIWGSSAAELSAQEASYALEGRYPAFGDLVPRDVAQAMLAGSDFGFISAPVADGSRDFEIPEEDRDYYLERRYPASSDFVRYFGLWYGPDRVKYLGPFSSSRSGSELRRDPRIYIFDNEACDMIHP